MIVRTPFPSSYSVGVYDFGFSRGAYTVRCLGGVLTFCGLPTRMRNGDSLRRDPGTAHKIAKEAVKKVYQHTSSRKDRDATPRQKELLAQRRAIARRFREQYGSASANDKPNAIPYFIGVFDTVASIASVGSLLLLAVGVIALCLITSLVIWFGYPWLNGLLGIGGLTAVLAAIGIDTFHYWSWFVAVLVLFVLGALIVLGINTLKVAFELPEHKWWRTLHFEFGRMRFYDHDLNPDVSFARHAISIDEDRAEFKREHWGDPGFDKETSPAWFEQIWFAGDHADIGGSHPENESRLSDITLGWMLQAAEAVGLKMDRFLIHANPAADGMQHD